MMCKLISRSILLIFDEKLPNTYRTYENIETTLYDEKLLNVQLLLLIKNEMYSSLLLTSFYFLEKLTVRRYFKKSAISFQKQ